MTINTSRSNSPETQHPAASSRSKCWTSRHERIRNLADLTLRWFGLRRQVWRKELKQTRECRASRNKPCELLIGRCRPSWKWLGVSAMNERWHKALYCSLLRGAIGGRIRGGPLPYLPTHRSTSTANLQPSKQPSNGIPWHCCTVLCTLQCAADVNQSTLQFNFEIAVAELYGWRIEWSLWESDCVDCPRLGFVRDQGLLELFEEMCRLSFQRANTKWPRYL